MKQACRLLFVLIYGWCCTVSWTLSDDEVTVERVEPILHDYQDGSHASKLEQQMKELLEHISEVEAFQEELLERTEKLQDMIHQINALQLNSLLSRLNNTVERQVTLRAEEVAQKEQQYTEEESDQGGVSLRDLERTLSPSRILKESEKELEAWIISLARDEVARQQQEAATTPKDSCASPVEAVEKVQESLTQHKVDGIGRFDHATAAKIVYEHTSDTYVPPTNPNRRIGNASWRRYIPQDWERVLPTGWEQWTLDVPSFVSHSLGLPNNSGSSPPEQILNPKTHVGSCWPMAGRSGQVLLRMPYPVKVDAVTLDHVSSLLLQGDAIGSAPRDVKVIGYPPCEEKKCHGMGFDVDRGIELVRFEYDVDHDQTRSVQTFQVSNNSEQSDDEEGGAECSATTTSCSAPPEMILDNLGQDSHSQEEDVVNGILVQVLDNWGNEDYTCMYRFRVHGEAA